jgi:hypothetical protein
MIGSQSKFIIQAKKDMPDFIKKAIDDLLEILDSEIIFPTDSKGNVQEGKLLKVVQSREQVYLSVSNMMDMINIDKSNDKIYKKKVINGMVTTWHELTKVITRNVGYIDPLTELMSDGHMTDEDKKRYERESVSDDYLSSVAKSKEIASNLAKIILERIASLDDPESVNNEKQEKYQLPTIAERYAK